VDEVLVQLVTLDGRELSLKLAATARIVELQVAAKRALDVPCQQQRLFVGAEEVFPLDFLSDARAKRDRQEEDEAEQQQQQRQQGALVITLVIRLAACEACGSLRGPSLEKLLRCSGCLVVAYCSQSCQQAHWVRAHRSACSSRRRAGRAVRND